MFENLLLLLVLVISGTFGLQVEGNYTCSSTSMCLPLSECKEIRRMVESDAMLNYARSFLCGYFHEPYVCCDRNCVTPNGNYGRSLHLDDCPHLKVIEINGSRRKKNFLAESHLNQTHVCCNEDEDTFKQVPVAPLVTSSNLPKPLSSSCITPNGEIAKCRHVTECEAYKEKAVDTDLHFRFINDSFCGFWEEPMVCCGEASYYKENYAVNLPAFQDCGVWDTALYPTISPWMALIKTSNSKMCAGALINREYVLATVKCAGEDYKNLDIKIGGCINNASLSGCSFKVKELKVFPLYTYRLTEDLGMVLLKLNRPISALSGLVPVCLPTIELAISQEIDVIGLEEINSNRMGTRLATVTLPNDSCHSAMKSYIEKVVCIRSTYFCSNAKRPLLQNFVLSYANDRWYLEGLFNKENCYGPNNDYFNAVYVYKFMQWIKSNLK